MPGRGGGEPVEAALCGDHLRVPQAKGGEVEVVLQAVVRSPAGSAQRSAVDVEGGCHRPMISSARAGSYRSLPAGTGVERHHRVATGAGNTAPSREASSVRAMRAAPAGRGGVPLVEVPGSRTDVQRRERRAAPTPSRSSWVSRVRRSATYSWSVIRRSSSLFAAGPRRAAGAARDPPARPTLPSARRGPAGRPRSPAGHRPRRLPDGGACPPGPGPARGAPAGPPRRSAGGSTRGGRTARLRPGRAGCRKRPCTGHRPARRGRPNRPEGTRGGRTRRTGTRPDRQGPPPDRARRPRRTTGADRRGSAYRRRSGCPRRIRPAFIGRAVDADWVPCPRPAVGIDPREQAQRLGCHVHHRFSARSRSPARPAGFGRSTRSMVGTRTGGAIGAG